VQLDLLASRVGNIHRDKVLALFRELEFRSLIERVLALLREQESTSAPPDVPQQADELAPTSGGELEPGLMEGEEEASLAITEVQTAHANLLLAPPVGIVPIMSPPQPPTGAASAPEESPATEALQLSLFDMPEPPMELVRRLHMPSTPSEPLFLPDK